MSNNMASKHSPEQLQRMRCQFLQHDQRGDAKIALFQLGDCLRVLGANPTEETIHHHIRQMRGSGIERLSFDAFMSIFDSIEATYPATSESGTEAEQFISCLKFFDEQNTGYIPATRLRRIFTSCVERLTNLEMDELLLNRVNDLGLVNYVEFVHAITTNTLQLNLFV